MKPVLPALVAVVCTLTACKTTADRRDLYSPDKAQGPYTAELRRWTLAGRDDHASTTYSYPETDLAPLPPAESEPSEPVAPPPPPSTLPESDVGAPAATPMPQVVPMTPAPPPAPAQMAPPMSAPATSMPPMSQPGDSGGNPPIPGLSQ